MTKDEQRTYNVPAPLVKLYDALVAILERSKSFTTRADRENLKKLVEKL